MYTNSNGKIADNSNTILQQLFDNNNNQITQDQLENPYLVIFIRDDNIGTSEISISITNVHVCFTGKSILYFLPCIASVWFSAGSTATPYYTVAPTGVLEYTQPSQSTSK